VSIEERGEPRNFESCHQFVGECSGIFARIGDEDFELLSCASLGHGAPDETDGTLE
jgi:hypothetical protein